MGAQAPAKLSGSLPIRNITAAEEQRSGSERLISERSVGLQQAKAKWKGPLSAPHGHPPGGDSTLLAAPHGKQQASEALPPVGSRLHSLSVNSTPGWLLGKEHLYGKGAPARKQGLRWLEWPQVHFWSFFVNAFPCASRRWLVVHAQPHNRHCLPQPDKGHRSDGRQLPLWNCRFKTMPSCHPRTSAIPTGSLSGDRPNGRGGQGRSQRQRKGVVRGGKGGAERGGVQTSLAVLCGDAPASPRSSEHARCSPLPVSQNARLGGPLASRRVRPHLFWGEGGCWRSRPTLPRHSALSLTCERPHVPGNVVAPASGLDPVHRSRVDPHQVSGALDKAVDGNVGLVKVLQDGPPRASQVVHTVPGRSRRLRPTQRAPPPALSCQGDVAHPTRSTRTHLSQKALMCCQ